MLAGSARRRLVLVALFALARCAAAGAPCEGAADCADGDACVDGYCARGGASDADDDGDHEGDDDDAGDDEGDDAGGLHGDGDGDGGHDDAGHDDAGHDDAGHDDAGHDDAGHDDAGHDDGGRDDAGRDDAGQHGDDGGAGGDVDGGDADAGPDDAGVEDAGADDAGAPLPDDGGASADDAGGGDAGLLDAGDPQDAGCASPVLTSLAPDVELATREDGSTAVFDVRVDDPTPGGATIVLAVDDPTEAEIVGATMFAAGGAGSSFAVTVAGRADALVDPDEPFTVVVTATPNGCGAPHVVQVPMINAAWEGFLYLSPSTTSGAIVTTSPSADDADALCGIGPVGGTAVLAITGERAPSGDWPVEPLLPLFRLDGTYVTTATAFGELPSSTGAWANAIVASDSTVAAMWTGLTEDHDVGADCAGWTKSGATGGVGDPRKKGRAAFYETTVDCTGTLHLLCLRPP